jgi:hypothetical protein
MMPLGYSASMGIYCAVTIGRSPELVAMAFQILLRAGGTSDG